MEFDVVFATAHDHFPCINVRPFVYRIFGGRMAEEE